MYTYKCNDNVDQNSSGRKEADGGVVVRSPSHHYHDHDMIPGPFIMQILNANYLTTAVTTTIAIRQDKNISSNYVNCIHTCQPEVGKK